MQMSRVPFGLLLSFAFLGWIPPTQAGAPAAIAAAEDVYDTADGAVASGANDTSRPPQPARSSFPDDTLDKPYTNSIVSAEDTLPVWSLELSFT